LMAMEPKPEISLGLVVSITNIFNTIHVGQGARQVLPSNHLFTQPLSNN
jgi:hypothetical protein